MLLSIQILLVKKNTKYIGLLHAYKAIRAIPNSTRNSLNTMLGTLVNIYRISKGNRKEELKFLFGYSGFPFSPLSRKKLAAC